MGSLSFNPMVEIPQRRFGNAFVNENEVAAVVCLRLKNNVEEYLVQWKSNTPPNRLPYSWHPVHELAGLDGLNNASTGSSLKHVQRYLDELRNDQKAQELFNETSKKRKSPDDGPLQHRRQYSPFDRLSGSRSPSVFSAHSDNSSRASADNDEPDTYNCSLEVKSGLIKVRPLSVPTMNTTVFPTKSMKERALGLKGYMAADRKIRLEFVRGLEKIKGAKPVNLVNTRDTSTPLLSFEFVDGYRYGAGITPPVPEAMEGCQSCRPNMGGFCGCEYTKRCECLEFARVDDRKLDEKERRQYQRALRGEDTTMGLPKKFPYSRKTGRLVKFYLDSNYAIFECNSNCGCGDVCKSRVVQNGRQVGLEIFRTTDRGWGLRCTEAIEQGQFIDTYLGEVILKEEADRRSKAAAKGKDSYLFTLDKFQDDLPEGDPYEIDGEFVGGPSRFINHSCDPNCAVFAVCCDKNNLYQYDLAFFALRDIKPREELTFDYLSSSGDMEEEEEKEEEEESKDPPIPCRCGSTNCRKILWK